MKNRWKESASDSDSGTGKAWAQERLSSEHLYHLITRLHSTILGLAMPVWWGASLHWLGSSGLWGFISTDHLLPDLDCLTEPSDLQCQQPLRSPCADLSKKSELHS